MDIKKVNVNLLLDKVGEFHRGVPNKLRKTNEFAEAENALARLKEIFAGHEGEIELMACKAAYRVVPGS